MARRRPTRREGLASIFESFLPRQSRSTRSRGQTVKYALLLFQQLAMLESTPPVTALLVACRSIGGGASRKVPDETEDKGVWLVAWTFRTNLCYALIHMIDKLREEYQIIAPLLSVQVILHLKPSGFEGLPDIPGACLKPVAMLRDVGFRRQ